MPSVGNAAYARFGSEFQVSVEPDTRNLKSLLFETVFDLVAGQRFAEHFLAHIDPLATDFPDRFFHPL